MTNEEILKKAIEKAIKNGYKAKFSERENSKVYLKSYKYFAIIFSHSFAKAVFGGELICIDCGEKDCAAGKLYCEGYKDADMKPAWQYHLQQMVLEPGPLKYLEKFIK